MPQVVQPHARQPDRLSDPVERTAEGVRVQVLPVAAVNDKVEVDPRNVGDTEEAP